MTTPSLRRLGVWLLVAALLLPVFALIGAAQDRPAKEKTFYLQTSDEALNIGLTTTQTFMNTTVGTNYQNLTSVFKVVGRWFIFPELAGDVELNGTVTVRMWWNGTFTGSKDSTWTLTLQEVFPDGSTAAIASEAIPSINVPSTPTLGESTVSGVQYTLSAGSTLEAHLVIQADSQTTLHVQWGNETYASHLVLPTHDYVRPVPQGEGGIWTLDSDLNIRMAFDPAAANKTVYIRALVTDPFGGYDVAEVNVTVTDPTGAIVTELNDTMMVKIEGFFNTFDNVYEASWNYSGYPEGQYNVTIAALDNTGVTTGNATAHREFATDGVFFIGAVNFVEVHVLVQDGDDNPLPGADVRILFGGLVQASNQTNASGMAAFSLPPGTYEAQVWWDDTLVGGAGVPATSDITFSDPLIIDAAVYQVTFRIVDSQAMPLEDAAMSITFPSGMTTAEPFFTDANGTVSLGLAAGGTYDVVVQWRGTEVADQSVTVTASGTVTIAATVYYVSFTTLDSTGATVGGALVTVSEPVFGVVVEARLTDASGALTSRLPGGAYEVDVEVFGINVLADFALSVAGDGSIDLNLAVHPTTIIPVDSRDVPLEGATVALSTLGFSLVENAGLDGQVTFRLPAGSYSLAIRWMNAEVYADSIDVTGAGTLRVAADVHYLGVRAVDRDGNALSGVFVTATRDGATFAAGRTDANGTIEFRLPGGTYDLRGELRRTEYLSEIRQTAEATATLPGAEATLTFAEFPPNPILSGLFLVILAILVLVALIGYIVLRSKGVIK